MLVEFQDSYNTCRWGGLYTNAKHRGKWACGSERSRVHTKLATAGLGRKLSAWVITIQGVTSRNTHVILLTNLGQFRTCHIHCHTPCTSSTSELISP